jgi:hypothetical protein
MIATVTRNGRVFASTYVPTLQEGIDWLTEQTRWRLGSYSYRVESFDDGVLFTM